MAQSYIGKPISLISHSDVRYRGILAGIDPAASTIQLSNVYSMGTESRRPPVQFIPPVQEPYQYIIFRASEVKDLSVDEPVTAPPPRRSVHDDPAVLGASAPIPQAAAAPYPSPGQVPPQPMPPQQQPTAVPQGYAAAAGPGIQPQQQGTQAPRHQNRRNNNNQNNNSVHTAAASMETVERALGDLRVSNNNGTVNGGGAPRHGGGGRRGGAPGGGRGGAAAQGPMKVPTTDFDFESSNAKFDKASMHPRSASGQKDGSEGEENEGEQNGVDGEVESAYNPSTSFFDSLSSSTGPASGGGIGNHPGGNGGGRGRRGGRGGGKNRREEEREKNVATFGEPGGVGLMGPNAYVGGWGRRGGRRGGRGGGGGGGGGYHGGPTQAHTAVARG